MKTPIETARSLRATIDRAMHAAVHIDAFMLEHLDIDVTAEPGEPELFKECGCNGAELLTLLDAFVWLDAWNKVIGDTVTVVRVYNNGDRVLSGPMPRLEAIEVVRYNKECRYGCAVFANGVCMQEGYLGTERCMDITAELLKAKCPDTITVPRGCLGKTGMRGLMMTTDKPEALNG